VTAETLARYGLAPHVMADEYTIPALAHALLTHLAPQRP
jgi:uroporphyrinogen-III synthase